MTTGDSGWLLSLADYPDSIRMEGRPGDSGCFYVHRPDNESCRYNLPQK